MKVIKISILAISLAFLFTYFSIDKIDSCYKESSLLLRQVSTIAKKEQWSKEKACGYAKTISQKAVACIKTEDSKNRIGSSIRELLLTAVYNKDYSANYIIETHNKNCPMNNF